MESDVLCIIASDGSWTDALGDNSNKTASKTATASSAEHRCYFPSARRRSGHIRSTVSRIACCGSAARSSVGMEHNSAACRWQDEVGPRQAVHRRAEQRQAWRSSRAIASPALGVSFGDADIGSMAGVEQSCKANAGQHGHFGTPGRRHGPQCWCLGASWS